MKKQNARAQVREVLRGDDGMTAAQIAARLGKDLAIVHRALAAMPDAYIDRWAPSPHARHKYSAVWCVVDVPPNCPRPEA